MKQAVILAAGEGQRLRPFTVTRPKTMLPIAGKPVLHYLVEALAGNGILDIVIVSGYRREQIFDYMGNGERFGVDIKYIVQERQLGTAHALLQARETTSSEFMVLPGDNLIDAGTIKQFVNAEPGSVLVKKLADAVSYGVVGVDGDCVREITEKPRVAESDIVNTGIYAFDSDIYDYLDPETGIPDAINSMIADGYPVKAVETSGIWLDIVYPWDMLKLNSIISGQLTPGQSGTVEAGVVLKGPVAIGKNTIIRSNVYIVGPVTIGENCDIGPNVCIMPSTSIGDNVVIAPFTEVENSVIREDTNIGPGCIIQDSVIDEGCIIKGNFTACSDEIDITLNDSVHHAKAGAMIGTSCRIGSGVSVQPGFILGNYSNVQPMKLLSGRLPDKSSVY